MPSRPGPWFTLALTLAAGCGADSPGHPDAGPADARIDAAVDASGGIDAPECPPPPNPAGPEVALAPPFDTLYTVYDLGPVPGVPNPLGGTTVKVDETGALLIAGASERADGALYRIGLSRDACGHVLGFTGTATQVATAPYVDANLVYWNPDLLLYTEWPQFALSQLPTGATAPARRTDLRPLGVTATGDSGPGGIGVVPAGLAGAGGLRIVTWPAGNWYRVSTAPDGALVAITGVTHTATLPNNPGGFAYVPAGSPGFDRQSLITAEWRQSGQADDRVAVYEVDDQGDPIVATRREFLSKFTRPWGAYYEPVTGDFFFLQWGAGTDRIYVVQGFVPPPPID